MQRKILMLLVSCLLPENNPVYGGGVEFPLVPTLLSSTAFYLFIILLKWFLDGTTEERCCHEAITMYIL